MDLRVFIEPQQGASYERVLRLARTAEAAGYDGFFSSDHYLKMSDISGLPGPLDTWTTLTGLARDTNRLRLGPLLTPVTFRLPGPLAIAVAQIDDMSGGRIELGLGAGWFQGEHEAYGIPFPPLAERFAMLTEYLEVVTGLWATAPGGRFAHDGRHYRLVDSPGLPKPRQQPRPPIILGGYGPTKTPALAARFADEFNLPFAAVETFAAQRARVQHACEQIGRDPASVRFSAALVVCCGRDAGEIQRRADAIAGGPADPRTGGLMGTPAEVVERIGAYADAGATRIYLQVLDIDDLDHIELVAEQVAPHL